jgi:hypothetical protein
MRAARRSRHRAAATSFTVEFTQQFLTDVAQMMRRSSPRNMRAGKGTGSGVTSSAKMMTIDSSKFLTMLLAKFLTNSTGVYRP